VIIKVKKGKVVVIRKAIIRLKKAVQRDFEIPERIHANSPIKFCEKVEAVKCKG